MLRRIDDVNGHLRRLLAESPEDANLEEQRNQAARISAKVREAEELGADEDLIVRARDLFNTVDDGIRQEEAIQLVQEQERARAAAEAEKSAAQRRQEEEDIRRQEDEMLADQASYRAELAKAQSSSAPEWVSKEEFPQQFPEPTKIEDPALRGVSLEQILALTGYIKRCLENPAYNIIDVAERSPTKGQRICWETMTMYQVCNRFIIPMTKHAGTSYAEFVGEGDVEPMWMTSHWWGTTFKHTIKMLQCHAQARYGEDNTAHPEKLSYWICTLAINQHHVELNEDNMMKSPFATVLCKPSCLGTVLLCDVDVCVLRRAWCILEIFITEQLRRMPSWAVDEVKATDGHHFLDVAAPLKQADMPDSVEVPEDGCAAILLDANDAGWREYAMLSETRFPLRVARNGVLVDVEKCQASVGEDKNRILNFIALKSMSCKKPPKRHHEYLLLNHFIHNVFCSAELFRLCLEMPGDCMDDIKKLLDMQADPNKFVRDGNNALLAAVGADPLHHHNGEEDMPMEGGDVAPAGSDRREVANSLQEQVVQFLLDSKANPNLANSNMDTALDCARSGSIQRILQERGGKTFGQMAPELEKNTNKELKNVLHRGCDALNIFSGSGGGTFADKLSAEALKCLQSTAALLQQYPGAPCTIKIRWSTIQSRTRAELEAKARAQAVQAVLERAGCRNVFKCEWVEKQTAPAVSIAVDLRRMDELKNLGGALLLQSAEAVASRSLDLARHGERPVSSSLKLKQPATETPGRPSSVGDATQINCREVPVHSTGSLADRPQMQKVLSIFQKCDSDKNGVISRSELESLLKRLKPNITKEQVDVMFKAADVDGDGSIRYMEFLAWLDATSVRAPTPAITRAATLAPTARHSGSSRPGQTGKSSVQSTVESLAALTE